MELLKCGGQKNNGAILPQHASTFVFLLLYLVVNNVLGEVYSSSSSVHPHKNHVPTDRHGTPWYNTSIAACMRHKSIVISYHSQAAHVLRAITAFNAHQGRRWRGVLSTLLQCIPSIYACFLHLCDSTLFVRVQSAKLRHRLSACPLGDTETVLRITPNRRNGNGKRAAEVTDTLPTCEYSSLRTRLSSHAYVLSCIFPSIIMLPCFRHFLLHYSFFCSFWFVFPFFLSVPSPVCFPFFSFPCSRFLWIHFSFFWLRFTVCHIYDVRSASCHVALCLCILYIVHIFPWDILATTVQLLLLQIQ